METGASLKDVNGLLGGAGGLQPISELTITNDTNLTNMPVRVNADLQNPIIYEGLSSEVNNVTGATTTAPVVCLGDGVFKTSDGTGFTAGVDKRVTRYETESANAESPQGTYTAGDIVELTDTGDGSSDGIYIVETDGSTTQIG